MRYTLLAVQLGLISLDDAKDAFVSTLAELSSAANVRQLLLIGKRVTPDQDALFCRLADACTALNDGDAEP